MWRTVSLTKPPCSTATTSIRRKPSRGGTGSTSGVTVGRRESGFLLPAPCCLPHQHAGSKQDCAPAYYSPMGEPKLYDRSTDIEAPAARGFAQELNPEQYAAA